MLSRLCLTRQLWVFGAVRDPCGAGLGAGLSLWLRELCSHLATWAGADRARLDMSEFSRPRWAGCPPHVDRCHLSSLDAINRQAARNHVRQTDIAACVPGASKASVPSGAEAVVGTPCGARTHDLRIKSPQL